MGGGNFPVRGDGWDAARAAVPWVIGDALANDQRREVRLEDRGNTLFLKARLRRAAQVETNKRSRRTGGNFPSPAWSLVRISHAKGQDGKMGGVNSGTEQLGFPAVRLARLRR